MSFRTGPEKNDATTGAGSTSESSPQDTALPQSPDVVPNPARDVDEVIAPCNRFLGKVIEVTSFDDEIAATLNKSKVTQPHWTHLDNFKDKTGGSISPVIIPIRKGSKLTANIKIEVTKAEGISGTGTIKGTLFDGSKIILEGKFPVAIGVHNIKVELASSETTLARHRGNIIWEVDVPGCGHHSIGTSFVEVYRIIEDSTHDFLTAGRPVEALRFLYDHISFSGMDVAAAPASNIAVTAKITEYFHASHGLKYDTIEGAFHYLEVRGNIDASFKLYKYINKSIGKLVNCYDQASAVIVFSGIMGTSGEKIFVQPFGYITETVLVGGVSCNNPFYTANASPPVVDRLSPLRTAFGNHQFYSDVSLMIFDACAGPHLGTETYAQYMNASVDVSVKQTRYAQDNPSRTLSWNIIPNALKITGLM